LQPKPGFGTRTEGFGEPDRHLDRDSRFPVQQVRKRLPRDAQSIGGFGHREAERFQALSRTMPLE